MKLRLEGREAGVPGFLGDKSQTRPFARMVGVKTPELLFEGNVGMLSEFEFPELFVVKPRFASTSIGVHLVRNVSGVFEDAVSGETLDFNRILDRYAEMSSERYGDPMRGTFFVEELLTGYRGEVPPPDIRAYMFQGVCGFYLVEDHYGGKARASYFNGDFSPMEDVEDRFSVAPNAGHLECVVDREPPVRADEVAAVAKRLSVAVPSAFCRVDMYDTPNGVMLGELTFYPGTFYYGNRKLMSKSEAVRLGALWDQADRRLAGSKLMNPVKTENP